jgi:chemotaxis protein histidine kinase CheA
MTNLPKAAPRGKTGIYKTIQPPDFLKKKIVKGRGLDLATIEARMAAATETLRADFIEQAHNDLDELRELMGKAQAGPQDQCHDTLQTIKLVAHNMKGYAGTFGFDLVTVIGVSLFDYITQIEDFDPLQLEVVMIHVDAIKAVIDGEIVGDGGEEGAELLAGMKALVKKTEGG